MNQSMFYNYVSTDMANPMLAVRSEGDPLKALAPASVTEGDKTGKRYGWGWGWVGGGGGYINNPVY